MSRFSKLGFYYRRFRMRPTFYVMKVLGRFLIVRRAAPRLLNRRLTKPRLESASLVSGPDVETVATTLKRDGICLGLTIGNEELQRIAAYAMRTPCYGDGHPEQGFLYARRTDAEAKVGKRFVIGSYFNTAAECPAVARLERDPKLWAIAEAYFGTTPRHIGNQLWWSFAGQRTYDEEHLFARLYHYDLDDYAFLKFFFYLTDVDGADGAHVCVRGSHRRRSLREQLRYKRLPDEQVVARHGRDNVVVIDGPAGSGFAEDTFCIHKGKSPNERDRLILQLQFAINDYGVQHDRTDTASLNSLV